MKLKRRLLLSTLLCLSLFASLPLGAMRAARGGSVDFWDEPGVRLLNQPLAEYHERRQKLLSQIKDGVVVILGNVEEDAGIEARYRQNNWMAYLTGVRTPGSAVMLVPQGLPSENGAREIVFIPPRNLFAERWTGVQQAPGEETAKAFGVERVLSYKDDLWPKLKEAAALPTFKNSQGQSVMKLYTLAPRAPANGYVREYEFVERARKELPGVEIVSGEASILDRIGEMRKIKSPVEIALLQKAIDITGEAQHDIVSHLKPGMYEYEVQALLEAAFMRNGAERPGFPSIVGSGIYSTILHYSENHKKIDDGDLVVCDIGAEYSLYTADITRTYPANGKFTERQRAIYNLVLDTQTAAAAYWKPGMTHDDLQTFAKQYLRKSPLRARDADGKEYTMDHFYIHSLGHWLGMEVHDVGDYALPIVPGAVFTIEPGVYIQTEKLGVRIEDDYVIAPDNTIRKLSAKIPSAPDDIERLMAMKR
ncbi:MAG: Xaa-Pro aminopeptidase [Blastocatellia bacterium]|jgi:Xaa-Pro aminopeptidase|nr:Xaa-Pro aminopeptidase [Blastocatellia bacterium]